MTATVPASARVRSAGANGRTSGHASAEASAAGALQDTLQSRISGEVRFDAVSRMLYSTDASNYQIEPVGVVIPSSQEDVLATIEIAAQHGVPLLPRGGGSSLAGQTVGAALVIDFSKVLNRILDVDSEARTVTVEPGINIDALNRQLKSTGLMFGPDPASANRATAGGVVGNNSTGSHSILYGMTGDNVHSLKSATIDGKLLELGLRHSRRRWPAAPAWTTRKGASSASFWRFASATAA